MYMVDDEVMEFALGSLENLALFGVLEPSMSVVKLQSLEEEYQRYVKIEGFSIVGKVNRHEVYSRNHSEMVHVRINRDLGVLEAYYPYKLQTQRDI